MINQKSNTFLNAKKKLEDAKKKNKAINIEQMKSQLYLMRKAEMVQVINANLLAALYLYYVNQIVCNPNNSAENINMNLFELKLALDEHRQDLDFYTNKYNISDLTPEISIMVS